MKTKQSFISPWRIAIFLAGVSGIALIVLGTIGAHVLPTLDDAKKQLWWQTAWQYQSIHTLILAIVGTLLLRFDSRWLQLSIWGFILGIVLFSGSLYWKSLYTTFPWPHITPTGGFCFIFGWSCLVLSAVTLNKGK